MPGGPLPGRDARGGDSFAMSAGSNYRAGGDAGTVLCLRIRRFCPGAPQHGRSAKLIMKNCILLNAVMLALVICGRQACHGQPVVSSAPPIVVALSQVDRHNVYVHPPKEPLGASTLSLFLKDRPQSKVDELVRLGMLRQSPVWVMDGDKIVLKSRLAGEAIRGAKGKEEYGLLLAFPSEDAAAGAAANLKLKPDAKETAPQEKN
jgi:hypothetical protein